MAGGARVFSHVVGVHPIYFRNRVSTMPEYLERRFGSRTRTVFALLTLGSYVFANFPLVFYTAGFALHRLWGLNQTVAVWLVVGMTGLYTVYGGLMSVAWTNFFQCVLLLGGGLYVFFRGLSMIGWNFQAILGTGQQAHLIAAADHPMSPGLRSRSSPSRPTSGITPATSTSTSAVSPPVRNGTRKWASSSRAGCNC